MTYHIGRKVNVGLALETTRGTAALPATYWLPKMDFSYDDQINYVVDDSSVNTISDAEGQDITGTFSVGSLTGRLSDTTFGVWLKASFGTEAAPSLVQTGVYDHAFTVLESASHPSLTMAMAGPNESTGLQYTRTLVETLEINFEVNKYCTYKVGFRGDKTAASSNTASYSTTENVFLPQNGVVKFATNLAGLTAASAITLKKLSLSIKKNIEEDWTIGALAAADRLNKALTVEGSLEIIYADRSYIDTIMIGDLQKAMRISAINTGVTIGSSANPTITIDLAKVKIQEVARKITNNEIVTQTIKFKAFYSLSDASMITATIRNTRVSAY